MDAHARSELRVTPEPRISPELHVAAEVERDAAAIMAAVEAEAPSRLTQFQQAILDFERQWWRQPGAKEQAIRDTFEMSPTRYYQSLNLVLDLPAALHYDAPLVNRLQRLRAGATRTRRLR